MSNGSSGNVCTNTSPCGDINTAYQLAGPGDTILMAKGTYLANQNIAYRPDANPWTSDAIVQPQTGVGSVKIEGYTNIKSQHVALKNLVFDNVVTFDHNTVTGSGQNDGSNSTLIGDTVTSANNIYQNLVGIVGTTGVQILNSHISPTAGPHYLNKVGIDIIEDSTNVPTNTLIRNNEIGPNYYNGDLTYHIDTIHDEGSTGTTIQSNLIWEGGSSATVNSDANFAPETNLLIDNNYIAGCGIRVPPAGAHCDASSTLTWGENTFPPDTSTITIRDNTVLGSLIDSTYGQSGSATAAVTGNISEGTSYCTGPSMSNNLLGPNSFGTGCNLDTLGGPPTFTGPTYRSISWGIAQGSIGYGLGVPSGKGFTR